MLKIDINLDFCNCSNYQKIIDKFIGKNLTLLIRWKITNFLRRKVLLLLETVSSNIWAEFTAVRSDSESVEEKGEDSIRIARKHLKHAFKRNLKTGEKKNDCKSVFYLISLKINTIFFSIFFFASRAHLFIIKWLFEFESQYLRSYNLFSYLSTF